MTQTTAVMQDTMQLLCHHQTGTYSATHGTVGSHVNDGPGGGYVHSACSAAEIIIHTHTHIWEIATQRNAGCCFVIALARHAVPAEN